MGSFLHRERQDLPINTKGVAARLQVDKASQSVKHHHYDTVRVHLQEKTTLTFILPLIVNRLQTTAKSAQDCFFL